MSNPGFVEAIHAGIAGLTALYRAGAVQPETVIADCLDRIATQDQTINAFVDVDGDAARTAARASGERWRRDAPLSGLDGVPIAIKANIAVKGRPWTAGMAAYRDRVADTDAPCVALLRAAGAIIVGATNMDEAALGATTDNPWFGRTQNPYRQGVTAGGSSGGSAAAVAAGFCAAALGTDTIGSVRISAAYCGVFGHKPQRGRVSMTGIVPLSPTLDTIGIIARSATDCALLLAAMTGGPVPSDDAIAGRTIAVTDRGALLGASTAVVAAFEATLARARAHGATLVPIPPDRLPFARMQRLLLVMAEVEGAAVHERLLRETPNEISPALAGLLSWGASQGITRIAETRAELCQIALHARAAFATCDALLLPATPHAAFSFDATPVPADQAVFCALASCLGMPATAFPVAMADGLPLAMQVVANDESTSLSVAGALSVDLDFGRHGDAPDMVAHP